ncbi:MAG: TIGR00725 family protein [Candidatus Krumholzibacteriota bacterium]|nr:TIGR00725 family protein [Candidatus Krumholzibacteriota bacterium]
MRQKQVAIIGDADAGPAALVFAEELGRRIGGAGWALVSGGRQGVMEAASRGCREAGGLVLGILPTADDSAGNPYCHFLVPTGMGWTRNSLTALAGDAVVAIGGRAGTLTEIAYAWSYGKPVLAVTGLGGWSERLAGTAIDDRRRDVLTPVATPAEAEAALRRILAGT